MAARPKTEIDPNMPVIYNAIAEKKKTFDLALAGDAPVDKFIRSIHLSLQKDPKLQQCDPLSLIDACEKAANDGLLLDGRQAALVVFNDRQRGPIAQYMPMYQGLMFRAYRSGMIDSWNCHIVYENELRHDPTIGRPHFVHQIDGQERIIHTPLYSDLGKPELVYSAVKLRGATSMNYDVMTIARIVAIARLSKKNVDQQGNLQGLWAHPLHKLEMAKKTVIRHHCKYLPGDARLSSVLDTMAETDPVDVDASDSEAYPVEFETARPKRKRNGEAAKRLTPPAEEHEPEPVEEVVDPETGEISEAEGEPIKGDMF